MVSAIKRGGRQMGGRLVAAAIAALLGLCSGGIAAAQPPLVIVAAENSYDVARDGSYTQTYHFEFRPTNDAAARREGQQAISYSPSLEDFSILDAYTRKPDGRMLSVAPESIHDQLPFAAHDLASFGDQRQKVIVFPDAAGGDTLVYTWRRVVHRPAFPGQFMASVYMSDFTPWQGLTLTIRAPRTMHLQTEAHGFDRQETIDGDDAVYRFHASLAHAAEQSAAVGSYDRLPRVFVSSFSGYDAFAAAYAALVAPHLAVTPAIRALADRLTEATTDRREQARLLYDWVSLHVRYVAAYLGAGALDPTDADVVLSRGWGDCKDHTVLFHALLAAKGIDAKLAMINLGHHYTLSGPPTFAQLNHAISYLPEFQLYADTTAGTAPFGTLPFAEYGKPVVLAVTSGDALHRVPMMPQDAATMALQAHSRLDADGSIVGTTTTSATGPFAVDLRQRALWVQANGVAGAAATQLHALGTEGSGAFAFAPPGRLDADYAISGSFRLDPRPDIDDGESFLPPAGLRVLVRPGDLLLGPMADRRLAQDAPTPCYPGRQSEEISLDLPPGRHLMRVPRDLAIDNAALRFTSRWSVTGQTVTVHRELVSRVSGPLCSGETRALTAAALAAIRRDEQRRIALADE
jgi:transglutaminase-like putative cysteine protease